MGHDTWRGNARLELIGDRSYISCVIPYRLVSTAVFYLYLWLFFFLSYMSDLILSYTIIDI